MLFCNNSIRIN